MKEFNKGDKIWVAKHRMEEVTELCDCCFGKRQVTLILGNDEHVVLPCDYCGKGYEGPKGYTTDFKMISATQEQTISSKDVRETDGVRECSYRTIEGDYWYAVNVFDNKEDAENRLIQLMEVYDGSQASSKSARKQYANKNYVWNAGYHRKCAKEAERQLIYHREKCKALMTKVKEKVAEE